MKRILTLITVMLVVVGCSDDTGGTTVGPTTTVEEATTTSVAPTSVPSPDTLPIIVDTDVSLDDAMAIPYLLRRPDIEILAVTVSGTGVAYCEDGVSIVLGLLAVSGAESVPVACGSDVPVEGSNAFPSDWRSGMNAMATSGILPPGGSVVDPAASDVIADVAHNSPVPPTVLLLGPHTNLAQALRDHPDLETDLAGVFMMGGAVDAAGNTLENPNAEWNLWIDPVADAEVLATDLPISIVPLDATNRVPMTSFFADQLAAHLTTPEARAVYDLLMLNPGSVASGLSFWDQLAAVAMVEPDVAVWHDLDVTVLQSGGPPSAGTLAAGIGRPASVAMAADRVAFEAEYLTTLTGEAVAASEWQTDATLTISSEDWAYDGPTTVAPGPFTIIVENHSEHSMIVAHGWLVDGATWEDLEAYSSIEQPPWIELGSFASVDPRIEAIWTIDFSIPGLNVLVGLDLTTQQAAWRYQLSVEG
ncbi:MAG: nucleoside hydrolase [Acidimicrobiia bacterium]